MADLSASSVFDLVLLGPQEIDYPSPKIKKYLLTRYKFSNAQVRHQAFSQSIGVQGSTLTATRFSHRSIVTYVSMSRYIDAGGKDYFV